MAAPTKHAILAARPFCALFWAVVPPIFAGSVKSKNKEDSCLPEKSRD
jgi:hypothetical protein